MLFAAQNITVTETSHSYVNYPAIAILLLVIMAGPVVGFLIGRMKGRPVLGTFLGIFHIVGWLVIALMPRTEVAKARHHDVAPQEMVAA